jgi:ribose 5-phosphate isomerase A
VIIADYRKDSEILGTQWKKGVPLEVSPLACQAVMLAIERYLGKPQLRMAKSKAGPVVTDNGNFIIDAEFGEIDAPEALNAKLLLIPGVLETGLFVNMAKVAYFGQEDGTVIKRTIVNP